MIAFIYRWTNIENSMKYIGSHIGDIDDGYIGSGKYFINAYRKNPDSFRREILEIIEGDDVKYRIKDLEEYYLNKYNVSEDPLYYNISTKYFGGDIYSGLSPDDKKNMIEKTVDGGKKDREKNPQKYISSYLKMSLTKRAESKIVNQFSMDGNLLNSYTCIEEASEKNNISKGNIHSVINGNRKSAGGYRWSINDYPNPLEYKKSGRPLGVKNSSRIERNHVNKIKMTVIQCDLLGNVINEWDSAKDAADHLGLSSGSINHFINGRKPKKGNYGGFIWKKGNLCKYTEYK